MAEMSVEACEVEFAAVCSDDDGERAPVRPLLPRY